MGGNEGDTTWLAAGPRGAAALERDRDRSGTRRRARRWARRLAGLPVVAALAGILAGGIFVERACRQMSAEIARTAPVADHPEQMSAMTEMAAAFPVIWPVRGLTGLSMALVAGFVLRARNLDRDRWRQLRALQDRSSELRRLSKRLDLALDASKVGVWDFDIDTGALIWDARMDELYALPADDATRCYEDWQGRLHPDDLDRAQTEFLQAIRSGDDYRTEFRVMLPDGGIRHIRAIGSVCHDRKGGSKIVGCNWDVTTDVRREAELEARRQEAEHAAGANSAFLATMSHEIRTPMNGVIGMLELLLRTDLPPEALERARIARCSAEHLLAILNDVLDLSKLEAAAISLDSEPVEVGQLARDVVGLLSATAGEKGIRVTALVDATVPDRVLGDATRLRQVLLNLVGNAVKFTDVGCVELALAHDAASGTLAITVRDTGIGIAETARAALFGRFVQVESADGRTRGGTGLGLAISRQIVELMGGSIALDSVPGLGSTFHVRVPAPALSPARQAAITAAEPAATSEPEAALASAQVSGVGSASAGASGVASAPGPAAGSTAPAPAAGAGDRPDRPARRTARILLAEDNETNRKVVHAFLEIAGHEVTMVENGAEAVQILDRAGPSCCPDVVLMDIQMPILDGVAATQAIRELGGEASRVPIVALTADAGGTVEAYYRCRGFDGYLSKPVSMDALLETIDALVGNRPAEAPDAAASRLPAPSAAAGLASSR